VAVADGRGEIVRQRVAGHVWHATRPLVVGTTET
jgi:hypothetical protein